MTSVPISPAPTSAHERWWPLRLLPPLAAMALGALLNVALPYSLYQPVGIGLAVVAAILACLSLGMVRNARVREGARMALFCLPFMVALWLCLGRPL